MNEPSFPRFPAHHLDPSAQEFFPAVGMHSFPPPIYYPFPPPAYDSMGYTQPQFASPPAYVNAPSEAPPPPPPVSLPPSSTTPSRTLLLSMVPVSVSESTVRRDLEIFGDVRAVQMERRREGLVTVHFYDLRDSQAALLAIQDQHMQQQCRLGRHYDTNSMVFMVGAPPLPPPAAPGLIQGRVVWAQFTTPVTSALPDGNNLGSLVIFNLDPMVSPTYLQEIFESCGPVKEMRETPKKRHQRFVEFFDVRNAAKAMAGMNGKEICGKNIVIEYSRPGGQTKKFYRNPQNVLNSNSSRCLPLPPSTPPQPEMERRYSGRYAPQHSHHLRNPNGSGGSKSSSSGSLSSLHGSVANLCINGYEECSSVKQCSKKKSGSNRINGGGDGNSKPPSKVGSRPWKGGGDCGGRQQGKDCDPRFLINEDAIMESNCSDSRTTVMIKNIPNKYSQKLLLNMLDNHCIHCNEQIGDDQPLSAYDFVYLPIDFINKCNVGYGFVNMTTPQATLRLYKAFHHQSWEVFNSRKICDVTYARLQGLEALKEHFKNSKFPGDAEEYMPVVFMPPRDGRRLTEPVPIVGRVDEILPVSPPSQSELNGGYDTEDIFSDGGGDGSALSYKASNWQEQS